VQLLSEESYGLAARLERAYLLGSGSQQPMVSGLQSVGAESFDYWDEELVL
jgi:hypothetical protein